MKMLGQPYAMFPSSQVVPDPRIILNPKALHGLGLQNLKEAFCSDPSHVIIFFGTFNEDFSMHMENQVGLVDKASHETGRP